MLKYLLFLALVMFLPTLAPAADTRPSYAGHNELAGKDPNRVFRLALTQKGHRIHAIFFAADLNGDGAQPRGEGDGRVNDDGVLEFKFQDDLANKGTATLAPAKKLYRFELRVTTIANAAPLHFYGVLTMKKVSDPAPAAVTAL